MQVQLFISRDVPALNDVINRKRASFVPYFNVSDSKSQRVVLCVAAPGKSEEQAKAGPEVGPVGAAQKPEKGQ